MRVKQTNTPTCSQEEAEFKRFLHICVIFSKKIERIKQGDMGRPSIKTD